MIPYLLIFFFQMSIALNPLNTTAVESTAAESFNFGYLLALITPLFFTCSAMMTKELANKKTHFAIVSIYAAVFGLPISLILSIVSGVINYEGRDYSRIYDMSIIYEVLYLLGSGVFGR